METKKYIFEKTGEMVDEERWGWGVVYKPTQDAIIKAEQETEARNQQLQRDLNNLIGKGKDDEIEVIRFKMKIPILPHRAELHQFGSDGKFHQIGEIEQEKVELFVMYKLSDPSKRIDLVLPEGAKIIHKYRNIKPFYKPNFVKVYMFGYKLGDQYAHHFILPDDRIIISNADNVNLETFNL